MLTVKYIANITIRLCVCVCVSIIKKNINISFMLQQVAGEHGLILVDTKYEFGKGSDGSILLIDEV